METTKEEIFKITYNEKLDKLQIKNHNVLKKIAKNIKRHNNNNINHCINSIFNDKHNNDIQLFTNTTKNLKNT